MKKNGKDCFCMCFKSEQKVGGFDFGKNEKKRMGESKESG